MAAVGPMRKMMRTTSEAGKNGGTKNRFHPCFLVMIPTFVGRCCSVKILQVLLVKFQCVLVHVLFLPVKLREFFGQLVIGTPWMVFL